MNFFRFHLLVFAGIILSPVLPAQNLVPNGSFEEYNNCPGTYSQRPSEFRVVSWRPINSGSPDYFNTCSEGEAAVPYNWAGVSDAYEGHGYAGIYTWMNMPKEYREYLHCKLIEPLLKDSLYHIEFHYKLSSYSKFSTDRIALLLSDSLKTFFNDKPLSIPPSVSFVKDSALTPETGAWEIASAEYRAKGHEQFLTIGNFSDNQSTRSYHIQFRPASQPMLANSAYYYIDDVKIIPKYPAVPAAESIPVFTGGAPELNMVYVLKNIQFEFNSAALMPVSFGELDKVITFLLDHPEISVRLAGHTDDVGEYEYNLGLSANRAKSVAAYLISKGIRGNRVSTVGYGEGRPLVPEDSEAARGLNRRVEIEFHR